VFFNFDTIKLFRACNTVGLLHTWQTDVAHIEFGSIMSLVNVIREMTKLPKPKTE